jgi:hypothetical protein
LAAIAKLQAAAAADGARVAEIEEKLRRSNGALRAMQLDFAKS